MPDLPMIYTGLRIPHEVYAELVKLAGGRRKGKDGQISALIRGYIIRGLQQDGINITDTEKDN